MKTFARTLLFASGVLLLAHYLPAGYWLLYFLGGSKGRLALSGFSVFFSVFSFYFI